VRFFILLSAFIAESRGNYLQAQIPSPQPAPRLGGEREWFPFLAQGQINLESHTGCFQLSAT
jgi:hypothetical protein